jgi:arylsulfatase A-like enzyme
MKYFFISGWLAFLSITFSLNIDAQENGKKNLLFIITDQQRYDAIGYAGNSVIQTPNIDKLAKQGAYFRNAYTQCAVCGPARASILTGYSVESTGVNSNEQTYNFTGENIMAFPTFDEVLSENGYHCEYYGKWHAISSHAKVYKNPVQYADNGSSVFGSGGQSHIYRDYLKTLGQIPEPGEGEFKDGMSKYPYMANPIDRFFGMSWEELQNQNLVHSQPDQHGELRLHEEHTMTAFQARQTLEAIERLKDSTFSITCSFHFPHSPMVVPLPYYGMYPFDEMVSPYSIDDDMENSPYKNSNGRKNRTEYANPDKIKYMISDYYGIITEIDHWIGKILDKLEELGIAENTMIIFTSDHGEMLGAHGMREKNVFYEESAHIPLLIASPGDIPAETSVDGYISLIDLFPTILDYMEVPSKESEGKSLRGLIEGTDTDHGKYVVTEWDRENKSNLMVVKDGWKLIIPHTIKSTVINALYDLNNDPYEINNLLGSNPERDQYKDKAEELRACLLECLAKRNSVHYYSVSKRDLIEGGKATGNDAEFIMQEMPDLVAGESLTVQISMKNSGTSSWTRSGQFKLGSQGPADNQTWGPRRILLDEGDSIVPGAEKTFIFEISVPESDGIHNFQWQMIQEGEEWFGERSELKQLVTGNPGAYLDDCDEINVWNSSGDLSLNTSDQKQGMACLEFVAASTDEFKKVFTAPYNSYGSESNTELKFWYFVSDVSAHESKNQVEIGSAGKPDEDEYNWNLSGLSNGWNFISLKTSEASKMGSPDLGAINWFRLYRQKTAEVSSRIDAIQLIDPEIGPLYTLLIDGGSGGGNYPEEHSISISANAPPNGQIFDQWIIESGEPIIDDIYASTTTLIMSEGSATVRASYAEEKFSLSIVNGSGSGNFSQGAVVSIEADPATEGYSFLKWQIDSGNPEIEDISASSTSLTMAAGAAIVSSTYQELVSNENKINYQHSVRIYPNPAENGIFFALSTPMQEDVDISLFDLKGNLLHSSTHNIRPGSGYKDVYFPLPGNMNGMYLVKIEYTDMRYSKLLFIK